MSEEQTQEAVATEATEAPAETVETTQEPEAPPAPPKPTQSNQFAALARKQRAAEKRIAEADARIRAAEERESKLAGINWADPVQAAAELARRNGHDPIEAMQRAVTELAVPPKDPAQTEVEQLKERLAQLEAEREEARRSAEQERASSAVTGYLGRVRSTVTEDAYPLLSCYEPSELDAEVYRVTNEYTQSVIDSLGERATPQDVQRVLASEQVQNNLKPETVLQYLESEHRKRLGRFAPKLTALSGATANPPAAAAVERQAQAKTGGLSNQAASESAAPAVLTYAERKALARAKYG